MRTITEVEGYRFPNCKGWNKTWVGIKYDNGDYYAAIFDNGMDFVPDTRTISFARYLEGRAQALQDGWTEVMSAEDIKAVAGKSTCVGTTDSYQQECILF